MARQTDTQIEAAVPANGTPNRALTQAVLKGIRDMADTIDWDIPANQSVQTLTELSEYVLPPELEADIDQIITGLAVTNNGGEALSVKAGDGLPGTGTQWLAWDISNAGSEAQTYAGVLANTFDQMGVYAIISNGYLGILLDGESVFENDTELTHDILFTEWNADLKTFRVVANDGAFDETVDASSSTTLGVMAALLVAGDTTTAIVDPLQLGNITPSVGSNPWMVFTELLPAGVQDDRWLKVTVAGNHKGFPYKVGDRALVTDVATNTVQPLKADLTPLQEATASLQEDKMDKSSRATPLGVAPLNNINRIPIQFLPPEIVNSHPTVYSVADSVETPVATGVIPGTSPYNISFRFAYEEGTLHIYTFGSFSTNVEFTIENNGEFIRSYGPVSGMSTPALSMPGDGVFRVTFPYHPTDGWAAPDAILETFDIIAPGGNGQFLMVVRRKLK